MEKITNKDIEWLLNLGREAGGKLLPVSYKGRIKQILLRFFVVSTGIFGLVIMPFFLLVRTSVSLKVTHGFTGWIALGGGAVGTILLLLTYLFFLFRKVHNKKLLLKYSLAGTSSTVLGFCMFSLFYLSGVNAKSPDVRDLYRSTHPILRVAITTVTLADGNLVITDIKRIPDDYGRMGLPVNPASLHYQQENGYVHAVDLRTRERGIIRNILLQTSLKLMGFRTFRHTGTADHLHVELAVRDG